MDNRPRLIVVLGPSGAGKSTFCKGVLMADPSARAQDDAAPLKEIFYAEREISRVYREKDSGAAGLIMNPLWRSERDFPGIWERYANLLSKDPSLSRPPRARCAWNGDGFDILDAAVWIDAAIQAAKRVRNGHGTVSVVELARGRRYASECKTKYQTYETYELAVGAIGAALGIRDWAEVVAVHVSARLETRLARNLERKLRGEHYVSEKTMREVYGKDPLCDERTGQAQDTLVVCGSRIPMHHVLNEAVHEQREKTIKDFSTFYLNAIDKRPISR